MSDEVLSEERTLDECPPGLFLVDGRYLGFKSEYATTKYNLGVPVGLQCDAYVVESGEYFWGGVSSWRDRAKLKVTPVDGAALIASWMPVGS